MLGNVELGSDVSIWEAHEVSVVMPLPVKETPRIVISTGVVRQSRKRMCSWKMPGLGSTSPAARMTSFRPSK